MGNTPSRTSLPKVHPVLEAPQIYISTTVTPSHVVAHTATQQTNPTRPTASTSLSEASHYGFTKFNNHTATTAFKISLNSAFSPPPKNR